MNEHVALKLNHTNLFMNEVSSFVLIKFRSVLVGKKKKKFDLICQNTRSFYIYIYIFRKMVFGDKNLDLFSLHKMKSFGLKKNIRSVFLRT